MPLRPLLLLLGLLAVWTTILAPARDPAITASATAGSDYVRARDPHGKPLPESYVLTEGKYFEGLTRDGSLERMTFPAVTRILAPSLAKQNYFPAPDAASAQLIIVVHWGATEIYEDPMKDINLQAAQEALASFNAAQAGGGMADPTALNQATGSLNQAQQSQRAAINRNAVLLGYARALEKERKAIETTTDEITLANELAEERYLVVLMAYDNQARLKEKKSRPLWVTRLSVRSPGNNFTEALPALANVGADIFGQQHDGLLRVTTPLRRGAVTLGELEVLGTTNEPAPTAKKRP